MENIYLKKLFTLKSLGLILLIILLNSSTVYTKSYIMDYFAFDELTQLIPLGPFSVKLSFIIGIVITVLLVGIHEGIFFTTIMNNLLGNDL